MDAGHELTDKIIKDCERRVAREYNQARKEVQRKLNAYLSETAGRIAEQRALLDAGKISQKDFNDFVLRKLAMGKRWEDMRDNLAQDYYNANQIAKSITRGYMPEVYALNHNYATYQIEHDGGIDTAYTLYDKQTVERLIRDDQILMPEPSPRKKAQIAANKDMQWNKRQLQSALTQSILQGESIPQMARRISETVTVKNYNSAVRYARTMNTSAQNAGRYDGYRRADKMGIDLTIEWSATLDGRTRHDHRMMHGQRRNVDEPFETPDGYKIYYPADCTGESNAPQSEIWNCRCTLLAWVKGFERDTVKSSPKMGEMSFEEWQHAKEPKLKTQQASVQKPTAPKEPEFKFTPAKTIQEAEAYVSQFVDKNQFGALGVSYQGISVEVANEINKTIGRFYNMFDVEKFGGIVAPAGNTKLGKAIQEATAGYIDIRRSFLLNRKSLKTVEAAAAQFEKDRNALVDILTHPEKYDLGRASRRLKALIENSKTSGRGTIPQTIEEAINHELGHSLEKKIKKHDLYNDVMKNMPEYNKNLSGYACESASEYFAESFCSYMKGEGLIDPKLAKVFDSFRR